MTERVLIDGLSVAKVFYDFINKEALPGTGIAETAFWTRLDSLVHGLAPKNRALLKKRDKMQAKIDAWHLARSQRKVARVILGMSQATADVISNYTLVQTMGLADVHPHWLQPRWPRHTRMWRDLLEAAAMDDSTILEQARLRGVQLLAAEVRSSALP